MQKYMITLMLSDTFRSLFCHFSTLFCHFFNLFFHSFLSLCKRDACITNIQNRYKTNFKANYILHSSSATLSLARNSDAPPAPDPPPPRSAPLANSPMSAAPTEYAPSQPDA